MLKTAVIMAGGLGTRLRPYTLVLPKPLMPVGEYPILDIIIKQLVHHGFERVILAVNHQAEIIKAYFGTGDGWGLKIEYIFEKKRLGTMGPLSLINDLPDTFLVMNGDILTDLNYSKLLEDHIKSNNIFTISASKREQLIDYGVLTAEDGKLIEMSEKPVSHYLVSMGIYALDKSILDFIPKDKYFGFDDLMLDLLDKENEVGVIPHNGFWLDIGRHEDYVEAIEMVGPNGDFSFDKR
jgi:NDP-sugar pyrophosphorylase family protein